MLLLMRRDTSSPSEIEPWEWRFAPVGAASDLTRQRPVRRAADSKAAQVMQRITVAIPMSEGRQRKVAFDGGWLIDPADDLRSSEDGADAGVHFGVAETETGRIAVHVEHVNNGVLSFETYDDLDAAEADGLPYDIAVRPRAELDPDFVEDLDI